MRSGLLALTIKAETHSALTNPVLEALYGLEKQTPISLYDCLVPTLKAARHKNPYDCVDLEEIKNWHRVAKENKELKKRIQQFEFT